MVLGSRCTAQVSETWPILPIAPKFAHPNSLILQYFEDNHTLCSRCLYSVPPLPEHLEAPVKLLQSIWVHIVLHSAYLDASGSIWKDQCGCSELLSCSNLTSKPFYIELMSWPPSVSPNSLDYHLQLHMIMASKCVRKLNHSKPRSPALSSLNRHLQAHVKFLSCTTCSQSRHTVCRWVAI